MDKLLNAEQLAEFLGVSLEQVRILSRKGALPHHRISPGVVRYSLDKVLAETEGNADIKLERLSAPSGLFSLTCADGQWKSRMWKKPVVYLQTRSVGGTELPIEYFDVNGSKVSFLWDSVSDYVFDCSDGVGFMSLEIFIDSRSK